MLYATNIANNYVPLCGHLLFVMIFNRIVKNAIWYSMTGLFWFPFCHQ